MKRKILDIIFLTIDAFFSIWDKLVYIRYLDSGSLLEEEFFLVIVTCCVFSCLACLAVFSDLAIFNLKQKKLFDFTKEKEKK